MDEIDELTEVLYVRVSAGTREYLDRQSAESGIARGRIAAEFLAEAAAAGWTARKVRARSVIVSRP